MAGWPTRGQPSSCSRSTSTYELSRKRPHDESSTETSAGHRSDLAAGGLNRTDEGLYRTHTEPAIIGRSVRAAVRRGLTALDRITERTLCVGDDEQIAGSRTGPNRVGRCRYAPLIRRWATPDTRVIEEAFRDTPSRCGHLQRRYAPPASGQGGAESQQRVEQESGEVRGGGRAGIVDPGRHIPRHGLEIESPRRR